MSMRGFDMFTKEIDYDLYKFEAIKKQKMRYKDERSIQCLTKADRRPAQIFYNKWIHKIQDYHCPFLH